MRRRAGWPVLLLLLLAGAVGGTVVGEAVSSSIPVLARSISIGVEPPIGVDLSVLRLTFGFSLRINVLSVLGMVLSIMVYRRL